jgi:glycosyltransferase involved in cell wall biosynthesis
MKLAFIYYQPSSFILQDRELLGRHFLVEDFQYRQPQDIPSMAKAISRADVSFSWFASGHSFLSVLISRLLRRKSAVVAGGYDVAFEPDIAYGQFTQGRIKSMYSRYALSNSDLVLAVSSFTKSEVLLQSKPSRIEVVYNAVDVDRFHPAGEKDDLVMTVASGWKDVVRIKGLDSFVDAAMLSPEYRFLIVGLSEDDKIALRRRAPENLELIGSVPRQQLIKFYQRARVYCQLSFRESFGVALVEAMACGCVPVVTARGALPEVVGDCGFFVPYGDSRAAAKAIDQAQESNNGLLARERVKTKFSLKSREEKLVSLINDLVAED